MILSWNEVVKEAIVRFGGRYSRLGTGKTLKTFYSIIRERVENEEPIVFLGFFALKPGYHTRLSEIEILNVEKKIIAQVVEKTGYSPNLVFQILEGAKEVIKEGLENRQTLRVTGVAKISLKNDRISVATSRKTTLRVQELRKRG